MDHETQERRARIENIMKFSDLGLGAAQLRVVESLGYTVPTPIQHQTIPVILEGRDLIGCAETGTGKTAAFLLPILQKLSDTRRPGVRVLVLAPTRELALQIQTNYNQLNTIKNNRSVILIGGANIKTQIADLRRGATVVVATPGRLLDLAERGVMNLSHVEVLVLDEADRMLDMGFLPAIRKVLSLVPEKRQTLLFSATLSPESEDVPRVWWSKPPIRLPPNRRPHCCLIYWNAKALSACWCLLARGARRNACRTFLRLVITGSIAFTLIVASRSAKPHCVDFATVAHAFSSQQTSRREG